MPAFVPAAGPFVPGPLPRPAVVRRISGVDASHDATALLGAPEAAPLAAPGAILDALADGVLVADGRGRVVFVNPAAERLLGWTAGALVGQRLVEIIPPRLRDAHRRGIARRLAGGESRLAGRVLRVPVMRPDGTELPVEMSLSSAAHPDGSPCFLATIRGIGSRVELETVVAQELFGVLSEDLGRRDTVSRMLQALAESLSWDIAALWVVGADDTLVCEEIWHSPLVSAPGFLFATRNRRFKAGAGLVGRVWETGHPTWVVDLSADMASSRAVTAAGEGVRSGVAFPVLAGHRILAVIELFSREHREPDASLVAAMAAVGARLGDLLERITPPDRTRDRPGDADHLPAGDRVFRDLDGSPLDGEPRLMGPDGPGRTACPGLRVPALRGEAIVLFAAREILYAEAAGRDVWLETVDGRLRAFERGLGVLEGRLAPAGFLRVHRHFLVNLDLVRELVPAFKGAFWVVLSAADRTLIPVSRRRVPALWQALGIGPRGGCSIPTATTDSVATDPAR